MMPTSIPPSVLAVHEYVEQLKASLGAVWSDRIANYSHYAWGDMDVVYGNLGAILGPRMRSASAMVITVIPPRGHVRESHLIS